MAGPDAARWLKPNARPPAETALERERRINETAFYQAIAAERAVILKLKSELAEIRAELFRRRLARAMKAGFNPDQSRDDHGRWTDTGAVRQDRIRLAGEIPPPDTPEIPEEPPPTTRLRNIVVRGLVRALGRNIWLAVEAGSWVYNHKDEINAYFDSPKTLEELQDAASRSEKGYDIHHVVERATAKGDGSEDGMIDAPENLVRIPRWKHWELNAWYETKNEITGLKTPREYLREQSWEERHRVGIIGLIEIGVLKP